MSADYEVYWFEIIHEAKDKRNLRAHRLRELRRDFIKYDIARDKHKRWTEVMLKDVPHCDKPTAENLRHRATMVMAHAVEPIRAQICGEDDAEGEYKEQARQWAFAAFEASVRMEVGLD